MIDTTKQEEVIKNDIKEIDKMWKEIAENNNLEYFLGKMTKEELIAIGKKYFVKGLTSLKKADVVQKIKDITLNSYNINLEIIDEKVLKFLQGLLILNGEKEYESEDILYVSYLRSRGIVFSGSINDKLYIFIPNDLKELLKNSIDNDCIKKSRTNTEIIKTIGGMAYYYGIINIEEIVKNINNIFETDLTENDIREFVAIAKELGYDYIIEGNNVSHIDVENSEEILNLQISKEVGYCKYDKKTLLKAGEKDFIEESKQGEKLKKVFSELFVIDKKILKEEIEEFIIAIKNEMNIEEAIEIFLEAYQIDNDEEKEIFTEELQLFAKSIKRWSYKGYSQDEFEKNNKRVIKAVVIGRNEPCICGSGKKHKKCCGK